jgi:hypothetical protein
MTQNSSRNHRCGRGQLDEAAGMAPSTDLKRALDDGERVGVDVVATLKGAAARLRAGGSVGVRGSIPPPVPTNARASRRDFSFAVERHEALVEELLSTLQSALGNRARESRHNTVVPERGRNPANVPPPLQRKPEPEPEPEPEPVSAPNGKLETEPDNVLHRVANRGLIRSEFNPDSKVQGTLERGDTVRPCQQQGEATRTV